MYTRRSQTTSSNGRAGRGWLGLALAALLVLPPAASTAPRAALARAAYAPAAAAASIVVNKTGDGDNVNAGAGCDADAATQGEQCTLRAAIQRAEALAGDDTITFNIPTSEPNCDTATGACVIQLASALPALTPNVAIEGPGADKLTVKGKVIGQTEFRVFNVMTAGAVTLSGLKIEQGNVPSNAGGGVFSTSSGTLNIVACVFFNNRAVVGGGVSNSGSGTVNITRSTFQSNNASAKGGAIINGAGTMNVTDSMIGGNTADSDGGGIYNTGAGTLNVTNSSIFVNSAGSGSNTGTGGGIGNDGTGAVNVSNCTLVQNHASGGGGIAGSPTVKSTIVAGSLRDFNTPTTDVEGSFTSAGFNFIGDKGASTGFAQPTDQAGTSAARLDPDLIVNTQPSGLTDGILVPRCGSPVVDKGTGAALTGALTTDARGAGFPRTVDDPLVPNVSSGDGTDIGAFERPVCVPLATLTVNTTGDADDGRPTVQLACCDQRGEPAYRRPHHQLRHPHYRPRLRAGHGPAYD
jgi:CSLREA domain-containing protein